MKNVLIAQINDVHLADHAPQSRTDAYLSDTVAELRAALQLAAVEGATAVILPGDLFHIPAASRVSHNLVRTWMSVIDDSLIQTFIIVPGNHDLSAGRIDSLSKQPIGLLGYHPKVELLHGGAAIDHQGVEIVGVEWNYSMDVEFFKTNVPHRPDLVVTHAPITRVPSQYFHTIQPKQLDGIANAVAYGHIHSPEAPHDTGRTAFSNPGALSRGSIAAEDMNREPAIAMLEFFVQPKASTTRTYCKSHTIRVPGVKPPDQIFKLAQHESKQHNDQLVEKFVTTLKEVAINGITAESLAEEAARLAADDPELSGLLVELLMSQP